MSSPFRGAIIALIIFLSHNCFSADFDIYVYASNKGKPNFEEFGIKKSIIIYEQKFYRIKIDNLKPMKSADYDSVVAEIRASNSDVIHLDIETWLGTGINISQEYIDRYTDLLKDLKSKFPNKKFGFYGVAPTWAHWNITTSPLWKTTWYIENIRRQQIADASDVLYPCLYSYHDNYEDWEARADIIMAEARKMAKGKRVVPFLWPRFHQSAINAESAEKFIPPEYWKKELDYVSKYADGVVVWNDDQYGVWDSKAAWWIGVQNLIKERSQSSLNSISPPNSPGTAEVQRKSSSSK